MSFIKQRHETGQREIPATSDCPTVWSGHLVLGPDDVLQPDPSRDLQMCWTHPVLEPADHVAGGR